MRYAATSADFIDGEYQVRCEREPSSFVGVVLDSATKRPVVGPT
jgi:hypothetical protein